MKYKGKIHLAPRRSVHPAATSLQLEAGEFIAELSGTLGHGKAGEKDVQWFRFSSDGLALRLGWTHGIHRATLSLSADRESSGEDVLDKVTENGVTTTMNYGTRNIYGSTIWRVIPEYRLLADKFQARAGVSLDFSDEVSRTVYPYVAKVTKLITDTYLSGLYSVLGFDIGLFLEASGHLSRGFAHNPLPGRHRATASINVGYVF